MDSEQVILIFTEGWPYNFHVSPKDFQKAGFFLQELAISFSKKWTSLVFCVDQLNTYFSIRDFLNNILVKKYINYIINFVTSRLTIVKLLNIISFFANFDPNQEKNLALRP